MLVCPNFTEGDSPALALSATKVDIAIFKTLGRFGVPDLSVFLTILDHLLDVIQQRCVGFFTILIEIDFEGLATHPLAIG